MATHHASPGEVVDLATWGDDLAVEHSKAITKTSGLELARLVLDADEEMHRGGYCQVTGPVVFHCIEGEVEVDTPGRCERLRSGQLLYLEGGTEHKLKGVLKSVMLLTIVLKDVDDHE